MDANVINELQNGLSAAYINGSVAANLAYKPAFVSNNPEEGKKVISSVEDEFLRCDQFQISVASQREIGRPSRAFLTSRRLSSL